MNYVFFYVFENIILESEDIFKISHRTLEGYGLR